MLNNVDDNDDDDNDDDDAKSNKNDHLERVSMSCSCSKGLEMIALNNDISFVITDQMTISNSK